MSCSHDDVDITQASSALPVWDGLTACGVFEPMWSCFLSTYVLGFWIPIFPTHVAWHFLSSDLKISVSPNFDSGARKLQRVGWTRYQSGIIGVDLGDATPHGNLECTQQFVLSPPPSVPLCDLVY